MSQQLKVDALSSEGDGIGSLKGLKVFVPGALPGEEVTFEMEDLKKNFAIGRLISVDSPSPHRVLPPCPIFGLCGGCQLQHLSYTEQLKVKQLRVKEALRRIGHLEVNVEECRPSPSPFHYRNKIQLPLVWEQEGLKIGLYRRDSHEIIPIQACLIQSHEGEKILHKLKPLLQEEKTLRTLLIRTAKFTGEALVVLVTSGGKDLKTLAYKIMEQLPEVKGVIENINTSENNVVLGSKWNTLAGAPYLEEKLLGKRFKISAGAFFQVNSEQAEALFSEAMKLACLKKSDTVWDAYCGVGTLALFAAEHVKHVFGTEAFDTAIEDAKKNARLNGVANATFQTARAEDALSKLPQPDVIFLNPPRKGCAEKLMKQIIEKRVERVIYISCDPATLARDLKTLVSGGYEICSIQPFDMFPQTTHVETLVSLKACPTS